MTISNLQERQNSVLKVYYEIPPLDEIIFPKFSVHACRILIFFRNRKK